MSKSSIIYCFKKCIIIFSKVNIYKGNKSYIQFVRFILFKISEILNNVENLPSPFGKQKPSIYKPILLTTFLLFTLFGRRFESASVLDRSVFDLCTRRHKPLEKVTLSKAAYLTYVLHVSAHFVFMGRYHVLLTFANPRFEPETDSSTALISKQRVLWCGPAIQLFGGYGCGTIHLQFRSRVRESKQNSMSSIKIMWAKTKLLERVLS